MAGENLLVVDDNPTILKVVESVLTRAGFQVDTALDVQSGMALARSRRPAVILVDSLIPSDASLKSPARDQAGNKNGSGASAENGAKSSDKIDDKSSDKKDRKPDDKNGDNQGGFDLCGALAADAGLSHTPVVLMTAKGEDLEARYARSPNVIDYITKPFSPDAVLAVVTHVIEKTGSGTQPSVRAADTGGGGGAPPAASAVAEALSRSSEPPRTSTFDRLREAIGDRLERHRQESGAWEIGAIIRGALDDGTLAALLAEAGFEPSEAGGGGPDLSGQLGAISMSEVLMLLGQQGQTGTLRVLTDGARVDLFFRDGTIDLAAAVGVAEEFLLGRFAVEAGDITPQALALVLEERSRARGKPPLFGRDLVQRGLLTAEQLKHAMRRQTAELAYEALRWSRGSFHFRRSKTLPEIVEEAALGMSVDTLLLEGFRRVNEWRLIERDIRNFDLVFVRDEDRIGELPRGTLTRDEIAVLDALSGKSTVRDVIRTLRMGSFDVSKILYRLLRTKLIRRRIQPTATI